MESPIPVQILKPTRSNLESEVFNCCGKKFPLPEKKTDTGTGGVTPLGKTSQVRTKPNSSETSRKGTSEPDYSGHARHFVFCLHGCGVPPKAGSALDKLIRKLVEIHRETELEKVIKWFYGASLSIVTGQELQPCPFPPLAARIQGQTPLWLTRVPRLLFGGYYGKRAAALLRTAYDRFHNGTGGQRRKALFVGQSFLMFKKGSPVCSKTRMHEEREKHREAITRPLVGIHASKRPNPNGEDIALDERLLSECDRTVTELFRGEKWKDPKGLASFPSTSGHFFADAEGGGAAGMIVEEWLSCRTSAKVFELSTRIGVDLAEGVVNLRHYKSQPGNFRDRVYANLDQEAAQGWPVLPCQISEPLKIRTVTCGPEFAYWLCMPVQKFLWGCLKKHPTFSLIGQPVSAEILNPLLDDLNNETFLLSGDFSAATDNIRRLFTERIWRKICQVSGIPFWMESLGLSCLTGHTLFYRRKKGGKWSVVPQCGGVAQENGQLMGSPLSFPILCIVNAVIARSSFDLRSRRKSLRRLPIRINGDDCGMVYNLKEYERWKKFSAHVGLSPSPGKCYFSRDFLQINSELFLVTPDGFERIPFLNFGLCTPRSSKGDERRSFAELGSLARAFVFGAYPDGWIKDKTLLWSKREKALTHFLRGHRETLETFVLAETKSQISWWLPTCYGGLGLPKRNSAMAPLITASQMNMARFLHSKMLPKNGQLGTPQSPFGRWTMGVHPWVVKALEETSRYEKREVEFEDDFESIPDLPWSDIAEMDDPFWTVKKRLDLFSPVLWEFAQRHHPVSMWQQGPDLYKGWETVVDAQGRRTEVELDGKARKVKLFIDRCKKFSNSWKSVFTAAQLWSKSEECTSSMRFSLEDFSRPRHINSLVNARSLQALGAFVPGPRDIFGSLPVPNPPEGWNIPNEEIFSPPLIVISPPSI